MNTDIFISYSRKNLQEVQKIRLQIETVIGKDCCWMDLKNIESGALRFTQDIVDGINKCKVFLFMLSNDSQISEFAMRELNFAYSKKRKVVIINIDNCALADEFLFMFGLTNIIFWNNKEQNENLMRDLKLWIGDKLDIKFELYTRGKELLKEGEVSSALKLLNQSANSDFSLAQRELALHYFKNNDYSQTLFWAQKAADQNDAVSLYLIGMFYNNGKAVPRDNKMALLFLSKASDLGFDIAQYKLGTFYYYGIGGEVNYPEALKWFQKAAIQGHKEAQAAVGLCYYHGRGVTKDLKESLNWFHKAASQGEVSAQVFLASLYQTGSGINKNVKEAIMWYEKAAKQGDNFAKEQLSVLKKS